MNFTGLRRKGSVETLFNVCESRMSQCFRDNKRNTVLTDKSKINSTEFKWFPTIMSNSIQ